MRTLWLASALALGFFTTVHAQPPTYVVTIEGSTAVPGGTAEARVLLDSSQGLPLAGWSLAVLFDESAIQLVLVELGSSVAPLMPDFVGEAPFPGGVSLAVVLAFLGGGVLPPDVDHELFVLHFEVSPAFSGSTTLEGSGFGMPGDVVTYVPGVITTMVPGGFRRGDCNVDGAIDVSDIVFLLTYLFAFGPDSDCFDACDVDDDGQIIITDAIVGLDLLFGGGGMIPLFCSLDPTPDGLDCSSYPVCP